MAGEDFLAGISNLGPVLGTGNGPLAVNGAAPATFNPATSTPGMGMPPLSLVSMAGMVAGALAPKDSWQSKLGGVATQSAQSQILAAAQLKRDADHQKFLSEALKYYHPSVVAGLANMTAAPGVLTPNNGVGTPYFPAPAQTGTGGQ